MENANLTFKDIEGFSEYRVNQNGCIIRKGINSIQQPFVREDGTKITRLISDDHGLVLVGIHNIIALAFLPHTPNQKYVVYKDRINGHDVVDNLMWCTQEEYEVYNGFNYVECTQYPGFYEIPSIYNRPELRDYAVSKSGDLLYKPLGIREKLAPSTTSNYIYYSIYRGLGGRKMLARHRLLCMVFKPTSLDIRNLAVNHINGIAGDDRIENLEWVSQRENSLLAGLLGNTPKSRPVELRNIKTGHTQAFWTAKHCGEYLGLSKDVILSWINKGADCVRNGHQIRWYDYHDEPWPNTLRHVSWCAGKVRAVVTRNIDTGEIKVYPKMTYLANELSVSVVTLYCWISNKKHPVLFNKCQVKFADDTDPWRVISDPVLEMSALLKGKPIQTKRKADGSVSTYMSAASCAREHNLTITALCNRLKRGYGFDHYYPDGYAYRYYPVQ